jgi:hypothetical protein
VVQSTARIRGVSRLGLTGLEVDDPIGQQAEPAAVHFSRPDHGHVAGAGLGDAMQQDAAAGLAGDDDAGVGNAEVSPGGRLVEGAGFVSGDFGIDHERHRAAAVLAMAGSAVAVQPSAGAGLQRGGGVLWVGEVNIGTFEELGVDATRSEQGFRCGELARVKRKGVSRPSCIVAAQALGRL